MSYTDVGKVAGMFPTFARGGANQKPSDSLIQQYLDDVTAEINAVLDRRFAESIAAPPSSGSVSAWLVALGTADAAPANDHAYWLMQADASARREVAQVIDWIRSESRYTAAPS